jgi:hypothetical protein
VKKVGVAVGDNMHGDPNEFPVVMSQLETADESCETSGGIEEQSMLSFKVKKDVIFDRRPSSDGMVPMSRFESNLKLVAMAVIFPNSDGTVPDN